MLATSSLILLAPLLIGADKPDRDLFARLQDPSHVVRLHAAAELGEGKADAVATVHALSIALGDPNEMVRFYAADSLAKLGKKAVGAKGALMLAFGDESWIVQRNVAFALGAIGVAEEEFFWRLSELYPDEASQPHPQLVLLYLARDPPRFRKEYQVEDLTHEAWDIRLRALRYFFQLGKQEDAVAVFGMLQDDSPIVRQFVEHLFANGNADAQQALEFHRMHLGQTTVSFTIRDKIANIGPEDIYSSVAVKRLYGHADADVREGLLNLIGRRKWNDSETIDFLKRMLGVSDGNIRTRASRLLDQMDRENR